MNQEIRVILARVMADVDAIISAMPNVGEADPAHDGLCEIVGHLAFARGLALAELAKPDGGPASAIERCEVTGLPVKK